MSERITRLLRHATLNPSDADALNALAIELRCAGFGCPRPPADLKFFNLDGSLAVPYDSLFDDHDEPDWDALEEAEVLYETHPKSAAAYYYWAAAAAAQTKGNYDARILFWRMTPREALAVSPRPAAPASEPTP